MTHAARALQSHDLSGEGNKLWITYILSWPHKDRAFPVPPPRQHKNERRYTPGTHSCISTRRIWNDDYGGQMIFVDLVGLRFPDNCLTSEENPKKSYPGYLSRPEIEPGPAVWQARMLPPVPQRWTYSTTYFITLSIWTKLKWSTRPVSPVVKRWIYQIFIT